MLKAERSTLVTSQVAVAEADYLTMTRLGVDVEARLQGGAFKLLPADV